MNVTSSAEGPDQAGTAARSLLPVWRPGREGRRRRRNERNNLLIKRRLSPGGRAPFTNKLICQDRLVLLIVGRIRGESESRVNATRARSRRERRALVAETDIRRSDSSASGGKGRQGRVTRAEPTAGNQMRCEAGGASREGSGRRAWTPHLSTQTRRKFIYFFCQSKSRG